MWPMRIRLLAAAAGAVLSLAGLTVAQQATANARPRAVVAVPNPVTLRVGTWNICGEFNGCPSVTAFQTKANMVADLVKTNFLHAILLNEVCEWHVSEIIRQFRAIDPSWNAHFAPIRQLDTANGWITRRTRVCDRPEWSNVTGNRHVLGIAVLSNGGFDQPTEYDLPTPPNAEFATDNPMVCVRKLQPQVRLCGSHFTAPGIDTNETYRRQQVARALEIVESFGAERVIWGGDFNGVPSGQGGGTLLDPIYDRMRECAQVDADGDPATRDARTGPPTARWGPNGTDYGKIDYLFVRSQNTNGPELVSACKSPSPTAASTPHSDHAPVYGTFLL
jgi:hypothetical protein